MDKPNQTPTTDAEKAALVEAAAKASQKDGEVAKTDVGKPTVDEVLTVLNETLKRDFKTREEAVKSLTNLNSMVGDNAIAELRKKAEDASNFDAIVKAYAASEGKTPDQARLELLNEIKVQKTPANETVRTSDTTGTATDQRLKALELELQEERLLKAHPEAKHVLKELKDLSGIYSGKTLTAIYQDSSLKDMATKASAYEQEKVSKETTAVKSNTRQVDFKAEKINGLVDLVRKRGYESDRSALVEAYIQQISGN